MVVDLSLSVVYMSCVAGTCMGTVERFITTCIGFFCHICVALKTIYIYIYMYVFHAQMQGCCKVLLPRKLVDESLVVLS